MRLSELSELLLRSWVVTVVVVVCLIQGVVTGRADLLRAHFRGGKQMMRVMPVRTTTAKPAERPIMRACEAWLSCCWPAVLLPFCCRRESGAAEATAGHEPSIAHQAVAHHITMALSNEEHCFPISAWREGHGEPAPTNRVLLGEAAGGRAKKKRARTVLYNTVAQDKGEGPEGGGQKEVLDPQMVLFAK